MQVFFFPTRGGQRTRKINIWILKKTLHCESSVNFSLLASFSSICLLLFTCWLWIHGQLDLTDPRFLPTAYDLVSSIMQPCVRQGSLIFSGLPRPKQQSCKTTGLFLRFGSWLERGSHAAALCSLVVIL